MKNLVLAGFMGTGKSTIGRLVARRLAMPFVDMDLELERRFGRSIAEVFATNGEAAFRQAERELAHELAERGGAVIAAGGGTILDRDTLREFLQVGEVVCLTAKPETLTKRLKRGGRPLLETPGANGSGREERIRELLRVRDGAYRRAPLQIATDETSPEAVAALVASLLDPWPRRIPIPAPERGEGGYFVEVTPGLADGLAPRVAPWIRGKVIVVTDENVDRIHGAAMKRALRELDAPHRVMVLKPGESSKTFARAGLLHREFLAVGVDRRTLVVAFGGGVVGDLAGFVAATHKRGLSLAQVPTTLVSQLDSAIGGKNGVNLPEAKNQVGTTTAPVGVLVDPRLLATLPARELRGGLAEAVKTAVIGSAELFDFMEASADLLARGGAEGASGSAPRRRAATIRGDAPSEALIAALTRIVWLAAGVKAAIVTRDPRETGERRSLNLGHTVGHALEAAAGYRRLSHGEAVAIGMVQEGRIALALGLIAEPAVRRIESLLAQLGLPVAMPRMNRGRLLAAMAHDKKAEGASIHVALPREIGKVEMVPLKPAEIVRLMAG